MAEVVDRRQVEDERLTKILDAVGEIVLERGVGGLTTALVARRARVAPGKFYELFADKYAVLDAATERNVQRYLDRVGEVLADNPETDLVQLGLIGLDTWVELCREDPAFLALRFWRGPAGGGAPDAEADSRMVDIWVRLLEKRYGIEDTPELRRTMTISAKFMMDPVEYAFASNPKGDPAVLADVRRVLEFYLGGMS